MPLLLDLHNLYANAVNFGQDAEQSLLRLPLARVAAVHLSGITVRGLDEADAHALRDQLARQLDDSGDAL